MYKAFFRESYPVLHVVFAGIILMIFIYSGIFPPSKGGYPIPSQYMHIEAKATASTGMSRAFSSIVRLDFEQARAYNAHSLEVFGFFFIQFWMRVAFFFLYARYKRKGVVVADILLSVFLFLWCFKDLIAAMYT